MTILQALILSVIEGWTEFLPVSSTGHLILSADLLNIVSTDFVTSFQIAIQAGAIMAIVGMYGKRLLGDRKMWSQLGVAFLPSVLVGLVAYPFIKSTLLGNTTVVLWSLFLGGGVLMVIDRIQVKKKPLTTKSSLVIGLFQVLSMIPGVSRAAATIIGGLVVGLDRKQAVEFSFLLAVPTMFAATGLDLVQTGWAFSRNEWMLLGIGFVGSLITAWLAVKFLLAFIKTHNFVWFGVYRIAVAALFLLTL